MSEYIHGGIPDAIYAISKVLKFFKIFFCANSEDLLVEYVDYCLIIGLLETKEIP